MTKKLLTSDEEYFKYCESNAIGNIDGKNESHIAVIPPDVDCKDCEYTVDLIGWNETIHIDFKPSHYPCIMIFGTSENFYNSTRWYFIDFIYQEDFEIKK
jgi:hypothetical protein